MTERKSVWKNNFWIGLIAGLIGPLVGASLFYFFGPRYRYIMTFEEFIRTAAALHLLGKILAVGALANLGLFFLFIRFNWYQSAKAVIIATVIYVVLALILRFV